MKQNNSSGCVVCGDKNDFSMGTRFYETESGEVVSVFFPRKRHEGYPGRLHGGMAAALLDETIGRAICVSHPDTWGVTVELEVKYHKPLPTETELRAVGRITRDSRKIFEGSGEILLSDGTVAVEAKGKYFKIPMNEMVDKSFIENDWYYIQEEVPECIDV
ncbi:MAG: PaaI family thioesterase [Clostridiales Family XIII bacterium]|nr:PaaI family thioesterase [Clostridiales Family XIII bacterium]